MHVERAGRYLALVIGHDETEVVAEPLGQQLEKAQIQVPAAPVQLVHVLLVETIHHGHQVVHDLCPGQGPDADALRGHFLPFTPDLGAALAAEPRQVVLEAPVALVLPVVLHPHPLQESQRAQGLHLVRLAEIDVNRGELVVPAQFHQCLSHRADEAGPVQARRGEEADPGGRRERHRHQQLRIVGHPGGLGGVGPLVVEDEFPLAVAFQVHRAGRGQLAVGLYHEVVRGPTGLRAGATRFLQAGQPPPFQEGALPVGQAIPLALVEFGDAVDGAERELGHESRRGEPKKSQRGPTRPAFPTGGPFRGQFPRARGKRILLRPESLAS